MNQSQPSSCFEQLERVLEGVQAYATDDGADKQTFVCDTKARLFAMMSALLAHPLGNNMALPFARARETDALLE